MKTVFLWIILLSFVSPGYGQCGKTLNVGWRDLIPFAIGSNRTSDNATGLDVEILKAGMEESGCMFRFTKIEIPWTRQLLMIRE
ncbi:hypothetical protein KKA14_18905 [bacterium]|nr:hypothetical protein [bacterium]